MVGGWRVNFWSGWKSPLGLCNTGRWKISTNLLKGIGTAHLSWGRRRRRHVGRQYGLLSPLQWRLGYRTSAATHDCPREGTCKKSLEPLLAGDSLLGFFPFPFTGGLGKCLETWGMIVCIGMTQSAKHMLARGGKYRRRLSSSNRPSKKTTFGWAFTQARTINLADFLRSRRESEVLVVAHNHQMAWIG